MGNRVKKYRMKSIPSSFSEKGSFNISTKFPARTLAFGTKDMI